MIPKSIAVIGENKLAQQLFRCFEDQGIERLYFNTYTHLRDVDVVIETINLDLEQKKKNLQEIENHISNTTTILTTSLSVTATESASWLTHPERVIGFGTFSNFDEQPLIEIALPLQGDSLHKDKIAGLFQLIGKEVEVVQDEVGLVYPRILSLIINEAAFALTEQVANVEDIDIAMKKGTNYPKGPLEWAELIGIEDVLAVLTGLYRQFGEERYRPCPLIRKLVQAGWVGGESGKGFYHYERRNMKEYSV